MNKNQTLLEINAAIAAMLDSNWSYFSALSYTKGCFCWLYNSVALIRRLSVTPYMHAFIAYMWALVVRMYVRVWEENGHILGKKTHKAGKIASIRGKKPHVYRVTILKQMADHTHRVFVLK